MVMPGAAQPLRLEVMLVHHQVGGGARIPRRRADGLPVQVEVGPGRDDDPAEISDLPDQRIPLILQQGIQDLSRATGQARRLAIGHHDNVFCVPARTLDTPPPRTGGTGW